MTKTRKLALSTATIAVLGFSQAFALDVEVKGDRNWLYNETEPTQLYDNGKPLATATLSNNKVDLKGGHKYKITTNTIDNLTLDGTSATLGTVTGSTEKEITRLNTYKALNITNATLKGKTSLVQAAAYVQNNNVPSDIGFTIQNLNLDFSETGSNLEASANLNAANTTVTGTGEIRLLAPGTNANKGTHTANFGTMSLEEGAELTFNISASGSSTDKLTAFSLDTLSVAKNATVKNTKDAKALEISTINLADQSTLYVGDSTTNGEITTRTINFDGTTNTGTKINGALKSHTDGTTLNFASGASMKFSGTLSASAGSAMSFGGTGFGNLAAAKDTNINISGGKITGDSLSLSAGANLTVSNNALANIKTLTTGDSEASTIEINEAVLNLGSNFELKGGSTLNFVQNSADSISPALNVDGTAKISSGATVAVVVAPGLNETKQTSYTLINATEVSADANAKGVVKVRRSLNDVKTAAAQYGIDIDTTNATNADKTVDATLSEKTFKLSESGNSIVLSGDSPIIDASTLQTAQADQLNALNAALEALKDNTDVGLNAAGKTQVEAAAQAAKAQAAEAATKTNAQIAQEMTAGVAVDGASEILNSAYGSAANAFSGTDSETKKAVYNDIVYNGGRGLVKDISDGLGSSSNLASSTASIINNINLSKFPA